ncbi:MAG: MaoC family dehydratase [Alphaproteobacteria bacterium]
MAQSSPKIAAGFFLEDFRVGAVMEHPGSRTLTEGDAAVYLALTGDRHPVHCNGPFARSLGFEGQRMHDLLVFHIVFGLTVGEVSYNSVANLGYADLRFLAPVFPGDTLSASSEVVGLKENSDRITGIVYVCTQGRNQHGTSVIEYCRWVMVRKRNASASIPDPIVPNLVPDVVPDRMGATIQKTLSGLGTKATGSDAALEDYERGEWIVHPCGLTLEDADHMSATRLYHNTARVHLDARVAGQMPYKKRLVYGGHIISLAYSLSYNGLQNGLGMLAWNKGSHVNPCFAGDTIYAMTRVLDSARLPGRDDLGALRLRLIGVKNREPDPVLLESSKSSKNRQRAHSDIVLDLDYWLLMPTAAALERRQT